MDYNAHRIARAEHNLMVRSLPTVSEFGEHVLPAQPSRLSRFAAHLLKLLTASLPVLPRKAQDTAIPQRAEAANVQS